VRDLQTAGGTPLTGNEAVRDARAAGGEANQASTVRDARAAGGRANQRGPGDDLESTSAADADGSGAGPREGRSTATGHRRVGVLIAIALAVLACDIITKSVIVATLSDRSPVRLLGGLLTLRVSRNPGAAFSIGTSMTVVFTAIAVSVVVFILRTSRRIRSLAWAVTLGLLLGGATGNLTDRLLRYPGPLRGYVVDWIQVPHWPVFNLADSSIVCGGALAVLLAARGTRIDGSRPDRRRAAASGDAADPAGRDDLGDGDRT
jgi:signal peptidase II